MEAIQSLELYELLIFIAIGLAVLFFGYKIKKIAFFAIWFLLGFNLMLHLMPMINDSVPQIANDSIYQNLLPIAGGIILGAMGFTIEKLCVAGITFVLVMLAVVQYFGTDWMVLGIGAVVGVIAGAFAVNMMKPAIIVATAAAGAYALTLTIFAFFSQQISFEIFYWPILIVIGIIGALFQFKNNKGIV